MLLDVLQLTGIHNKYVKTHKILKIQKEGPKTK